MAEISVAEYLAYFSRQKYGQLFDGACLERLKNVEACYGQLKTEETILEVCLSLPEKQCDYSICVKTDHPLVKEYWYELDYEACKNQEITPCCFVDGSAAIPGADRQVFYREVLFLLAGEERIRRLTPVLDRCVDALEGRCPCLFQIGVMTGRQQHDSIRLFTEDMSRADGTAYLKEIGWTGDLPALDACLAFWETYSDGGQFILDFDLYEDRISDKIGINFGTRAKDPETVEACLLALENQGLCLPGKKEDILRFCQAFPSHTPLIQNDISHFKIPFQSGRSLTAKAYLRQGGKCYWPDFRAYETPALMNLELTTRCPLHCPQCYCELGRGKDMEVEKALYWIRQAGERGVRTVNLSGGETMCYPELGRLVRACRDGGMEANIAVSGWGFHEEALKELTDSGVSEICVSLNGSSEAVNQKTRDGYSLAIRALELLKEQSYPRTVINWVMHGTNVEDFPQMLVLAEQYHVSCLTVMMRKPDSSGSLWDMPEKEQMYEIAAQIRQYRGPVRIEVEECFSQMRAILGKRFFTNLNRGISRGCGAGRDGFSVSVEGKPAPCRHLELEEDFDTISSYWEKSEVLEKLRRVEEDPQEPCGRCGYRRFCLPCMAGNWKQKGRLAMGDASCPVRPD